VPNIDADIGLKIGEIDGERTNPRMPVLEYWVCSWLGGRKSKSSRMGKSLKEEYDQ
jgi:hypothetical protein